MYQNIARIIKECREYAGLTQQQLADRIYVDVETIKSYENCRIKNIPEENLAKIADVCLTPWAKSKFLWWISPLYKDVIKKQPNCNSSHAEITISAIRQMEEFKETVPTLMDYACGRICQISDTAVNTLQELTSTLLALSLKPKEKSRTLGKAYDFKGNL